jgi:hypothetical protein
MQELRRGREEKQGGACQTASQISFLYFLE